MGMKKIANATTKITTPIKTSGDSFWANARGSILTGM